MSEYFWVQFSFDSESSFDELKETAFNSFNSTGMEEFSLEESVVDEILGERSYSGGDIPNSVLNEVETNVLTNKRDEFKFYFVTSIDAENFKKLLNEKNIESKVFSEETKDWNENWKKHYKLIEVSEDFAIIPSWEKDGDHNYQTKLYIYPGMGFGTGSHETTFLCMKHSLDFIDFSNIKNCLDFGCGSGILGIGANLLNNKIKVDLLDIDDEALVNSKQNIILNELSESSFHLLLADEYKSLNNGYDLVFANILQNVLLSEADKIVSKVNMNGVLIISGLLSGQENEVIEKYRRIQNFEVLKVENMNQWSCVSLKRI